MKFTFTHRRAQSRLPKGEHRHSLHPSVIGAIWDAVTREATRFECSKSFVMAVALSHVFDIDLGEHYAERSLRKRTPRTPRIPR